MKDTAKNNKKLISRINRRLKKLIGLPTRQLNKTRTLLRKHRYLKRNNFTVEFKHEGSVQVFLPKIRYYDFLFRKKRQLVNQSFDFISRPNKETLLRRLVYSMYENEIIDANSSVVDIGSWLADNTIVWSKFLNSDCAVVYAIDPGVSNIHFGKLLSAINNCANIKWIEAVCSDSDGSKVFYEGELDHASFNMLETGRNAEMPTTTLDTVVGQNHWDSIGLLHVDVEGFELKVIKGAANIIKYSKPIILFEQHISMDNVGIICELLRERSYLIYMINEVLPGCQFDCRNFIAIPDGIDISDVINVENTRGRDEEIWYATLGSAVILIDPD